METYHSAVLSLDQQLPRQRRLYPRVEMETFFLFSEPYIEFETLNLGKRIPVNPDE
jgi:hypothetical protein